jgi:hypothetical protein
MFTGGNGRNHRAPPNAVGVELQESDRLHRESRAHEKGREDLHGFSYERRTQEEMTSL